MKKLILLFILLTLTTLNSNSQWEQQYTGIPQGQALLDVSFINRYTGWVCGQGGVIMKTTNAGTNWVEQNTGITNKDLHGIHAVDSQYVYAVGWFQTILKTTNGGSSWIIIRNGTWGNDPSFFGLYFLNRTTGWLLRNEYILRTINGGISFDSTHINNWPRDAYFKDALTGVVCAEAAEIFKSTDGGIVWDQIIIPQTTTESPDFYKESFIGNTGWVIGRGSNVSGLGPNVWRTTNFGSSWDTIGRVPYPYTLENYCVYFSSLITGWCGGTNGWMFKSTNGGANWIQQVAPGGFKRSMYMYSDSIGWAVGSSGLVLYTTTGGQYVDVKKISELIPNIIKLYQNYPNPFNPETKIKFDTPPQPSPKGRGQRVRLVVYNILGREIAVLVDKQLNPGTYEVEWDGSNASAGVYFYRLITSDYTITRKMILIK